MRKSLGIAVALGLIFCTQSFAAGPWQMKSSNTTAEANVGATAGTETKAPQQTQETNLDAQIAELKAQIAELEKQIAELKTQLNQNQKEISSLEAELKAEKAKLAELEAQKAALDKQSSELSDNVTALEKEIKDRQALLEQLKALQAKLQNQTAVAKAPQEQPKPATESKKPQKVQVVKEKSPQELAREKFLSLPNSYTVKEGDTLWSIAGKPDIYGDPCQWPLIYWANSKQIKNPTLIYPGQVLKIPRNITLKQVEKARANALKLAPTVKKPVKTPNSCNCSNPSQIPPSATDYFLLKFSNSTSK